MAEQAAMTSGEAARLLGVTIETVLEWVYDGRLAVAVDRPTGRLQFHPAELRRVEERWGASAERAEHC